MAGNPHLRMRYQFRSIYFYVILLVLGGCVPPSAALQLGIDQISLGPLAIHDHVTFDFHIPIENDPYPHEFKQGYAFDGVDMAAVVAWHVGRSRMSTALRVTPASRDHFAYDQDTDFESGDAFTHGDAGHAQSRTFGVAQSFPILQSSLLGALGYDVGFTRQWTRFNQVETYDLNTNPALPSTVVSRVIGEQAIVYELRSSFNLEREAWFESWRLQADLQATPQGEVFLHNYIPVIEAATSTDVYGFGGTLAASHNVGSWWLRLSGRAEWENSYHSISGFRREVFFVLLEVAPHW